MWDGECGMGSVGWGVWDGECGIGSVGEECGGSVGDGVWEGSGGVGCVRRWSVGWGVWWVCKGQDHSCKVVLSDTCSWLTMPD